MNARTLLPVAAATLLAACASAPSSPGSAPAARANAAPSATYYVYVGAESADLIHRVKLDAAGVSIDQTTPVGEMAVENEGPHGLNISPDGAYLYMTTAHGVPDGKLWKFAAGPDTLVAPPILLGNFPATLDLTPDGLYAFVANFNLHGEHVPSTVSVVYTPDMVEVEQIPTCTMPHGLRLAPDGLFAYSLCMMDDQLVEIDTRTFEVSRRFTVSTGKEAPLRGYHVPEVVTGPSGMTRPVGEMGRMGMHGDHTAEPSCSPTWVQPAPDGRTLYVACNKSDEILVVDRESWSLVRKFPAGRAPYNLGITPDGAILVASLKGAGQVQFFDAATGEAKATVPSTTTVTHGVAITPDSRYAFVSVEGVGAEPGKVDVYDLRTFELVGSVGVGQQAGGIVFWRMAG
jgi:DNA-binding beta-propeller fold protein YncE